MPAHKTPLKMYKHIAASQVVAGPMGGAMKSMKLYPLSLTQTVILYGMNSLANAFPRPRHAYFKECTHHPNIHSYTFLEVRNTLLEVRIQNMQKNGFIKGFTNILDSGRTTYVFQPPP